MLSGADGETGMAEQLTHVATNCFSQNSPIITGRSSGVVDFISDLCMHGRLTHTIQVSQPGSWPLLLLQGYVWSVQEAQLLK